MTKTTSDPRPPLPAGGKNRTPLMELDLNRSTPTTFTSSADDSKTAFTSLVDDSIMTFTSEAGDSLTTESFLLSSNVTLEKTLDGSTSSRNSSCSNSCEVKIILDNGGVVCAASSSSESDIENNIESEEIKTDCCKLESVQRKVQQFFHENSAILKKLLWIIMLLGYVAFFIAACVIDVNRAMALVVVTSLVIAWVTYSLIRDRIGGHLYKKCYVPVAMAINNNWSIVRWFVYIGLVAALITYIAVEIRPKPRQLISLAGFLMFLFFLFIFSKNPSKVKWRTVIWGLAIQFVLGIVILRTDFGFKAFKYLGDQAQEFLKFTDYGSSFVFGKNYEDHLFAFKVLPVIIFFSCAISTLYHLGVMQSLIGKIAWVMQVTMGTSATESLCAAGNIFVGQTEAPILVRPFIGMMTNSEIHAMMTGGFATIAGGVLAAYILFGVPAEHLLCASVMNAPVALAVSKLFYPETEQSKFTDSNDIPMEKGKERNLLEAASAGASSSIKLVANIAANLIAFLAMLAFINAALSWFGSLVDLPELTFQVICSYVFMPVAFMMGVDWSDADKVGELLGIKLFLNEFVAYKQLSGYIKNRSNCIQHSPQISYRSEVIATYLSSSLYCKLIELFISISCSIALKL
ncbi:solute carrier family 28 member 3-like isoform X2 [Tubulanus polymorphus]|uniref:solute carrier family 28 member 3-like isoform X2 n=1 Tax=Tubulanus polymorphus TaxID=672921 RepID=UPI003DA2C886